MHALILYLVFFFNFDYYSGTGEGVLSYRCTYRTVVDEDGCHFTVDHNVQIVNEGSDDGPPMTIKLTVSTQETHTDSSTQILR